MENLLIASKLNIKNTVAVLNRGGVIGYPTETVYGLGGNPLNTGTISRIIRLKQRDVKHPMLILIPDGSFLSSLVCDVTDAVHQLIHRFWPGPLTLIFQAREGLPTGLTGFDGSIGIRISSDPVCQILMKYLKGPIISTSANPKGEVPARSASEVYQYFGPQLDIILDDGVRNRNEPSTVLDIRSTPVKLLRKGAVESAEIRQVIGAVIETDDL